MTSVLNVDTIANKAGTGPVGLTKQEAAKIRCRFNQTTPALETGSLNVSSISDDATAKFTISPTSSMNDAVYSVTGISASHGSNNVIGILTKKNDQNDYSTSAVPCCSGLANNSFGSDLERSSVVVFGDLA